MIKYGMFIQLGSIGIRRPFCENNSEYCIASDVSWVMKIANEIHQWHFKATWLSTLWVQCQAVLFHDTSFLIFLLNFHCDINTELTFTIINNRQRSIVASCNQGVCTAKTVIRSLYSLYTMLQNNGLYMI